MGEAVADVEHGGAEGVGFVVGGVVAVEVFHEDGGGDVGDSPHGGDDCVGAGVEEGAVEADDVVAAGYFA